MPFSLIALKDELLHLFLILLTFFFSPPSFAYDFDAFWINSKSCSVT